jgi:hypothetical protein
MATESYITKLLTLLIKRAGGAIRIPILDLMEDDLGQGLSVHHDKEAKELVLTFVPAGAKIYTIKESQSWVNSTLLHSSPLPLPSQPLSQEELIARVWTESASTPTLAEDRQPRQQKNRVVTLTDERQSEIELERRKQAALKEVMEFQTSPSSQERSSPLPRTGVRETFYKQ